MQKAGSTMPPPSGKNRPRRRSSLLHKNQERKRCRMKNWNETFRSLNVGLPDDVERLKAAGYYQEAIERIDAYLAEDWTVTQNSPRSQGAEPVGEELPQNPTPHGVEALRDAMLAQREIMHRIPAEYCYTEDEAVARMQGMVRDFTREEFRLLVKEGRVDWRFVEGEKHYLDRFAETRPSGRSSGRQTSPRTAALGWSTATGPRPSTQTRWTSGRMHSSRPLTPARKRRTSSSRPICGRWPTS